MTNLSQGKVMQVVTNHSIWASGDTRGRTSYWRMESNGGEWEMGSFLGAGDAMVMSPGPRPASLPCH